MDVDHAGGAPDRAAAQRSGRARQAQDRPKPRSPPANWRRRWRWKRSRHCWACDGRRPSSSPASGRFPARRINPTEAAGEAAWPRASAARDATSSRIFSATSYAAVDRDLPKLLRRHRPDALLMFGLATQPRICASRRMRETFWRRSPMPMASCRDMRPIAPGRQATLRLPTPRRANCSRPRAPPVSKRRCRTMPAAISATICAGGRRWPRGCRTGRVSRRSSTCPPVKMPADLARAGRRFLRQPFARLV